MSGRPPSPVSPLWRQTPTASRSTKGQADRRWSIFVLLASILVLAGSLVGLLGWIRPLPRPYLFPVWVSSYQSRQLSFIPWAERDFLALSRGGYFSRIINAPFGSQDRRTIHQELELLGERLPTDSVVVYVNSRACVGPSGEVTLFPADADPDDMSTWIPLREILEALRASPAGWKLLILDLMKPRGGTRTAVFDDDLASRVPEDLKAVDDPSRLTLTAAAPGQFSLVSEELGRSVFSYYLEEGLRGWTELDRTRLSRDGLVRVSDLAAYVRSRVDRWARLNRGVRQEPVLYGDGADFPLLALRHDRLQPAPPSPPAVDYPGWLEAGWQVRDRWRAEGNDQLAPLAFRQMQLTLLAAEIQWRGGVDPARIQQDRMGDLAISQKLLETIQATPRPRPVSLAMAAAHGWKQNPAVSNVVTDLLAKRAASAKPAAPGATTPETAKPEAAKAEGAAAKAGAAKPEPGETVGTFVEKTRDASMFDLAGAIFDAARKTEPTRETILFLDGLLRDQQPEPLYVETLFLRQLADLARAYDDASWPTEMIRRALKVASQGEQANSRHETLAWLRTPLEQAAQLRHDAEVILRARGFASLAEADRLFRMAEARYAVILEQQQVVLATRRLWLETLQFLPLLLDDSQAPAVGQDRWDEIVEKLIAARDAFTLPDDVKSGAAPLSIDDVRARLESLHAQTESLRQDLGELRKPFSEAALTALLAEAHAPRAGPETLGAIEAVLRSPTATAKQRVDLWRAGRDLSRRLLKQTLQLDRSRLDPESVPHSDPVEPRESYVRRLAERAHRRILLLRLAGLPDTKASPLNDKVAKAEAQGDDPVAWWAVEMALSAAWNGESHRMMGLRRGDPNAGTHLNPLVVPAWSIAYTDATPRGLYFATWVEERRRLWAWLADHYEYEGADLGGSPFFRTAARELRAVARGTERARVLSPWESAGPVVTLSAENPATSESLPLRIPAGPGAGEPTPIDILLADSTWLRIGPASTQLQRSGRAGAEADGLGASYHLRASASPLRRIPLHVELDPEAEESGTTPPRGFLVRARVGGRDFHQAVAVELQLASRRIQILLSTDPKAPTAPQLDLGLRAIKDRQPYYLYLRNPTSEPREVQVELTAGGQAVPGNPPQLTVAPGAIDRVSFAPGSIKAEVPLPELAGPLQILLRSAADKKTILGQATVGVRVAAPAEYVRVSHVEYAPASAGRPSDNRLSVVLRSGTEIAGPPAVAQLILPPDQIPGFLGMGDGTLRSVLPADGSLVTLFVKNLRRTPGADRAGTFYVQVDSYPRGIAFRATFPRDGQPTFPLEDTRPVLRLRAARSTPATATFPVRAEVDNPGPGFSLEVVLGRSRAGAFEPEAVRRFATAQHRRIGFSPGGPDGALLFEAAVDDWSTTLDLSGIEGSRILRARLLDEGGNEIQTVSQSLLIDNSQPTGPGFVDLPPQARRGTKLTVKATARATDSGIGTVLFFVGRPPAAGGPLPATVATTPGNADGDGLIWSAELPLPDLKGPTDLGAQFVSGAGQTSYATATIELTDTDPITPGRIVGTVLEGPRPQPGLVVILSQTPKDDAKTNDAKTKPAQAKEAQATEIARATTTADGVFRFDNLAPGTYHLATSKEASRTKAKADVEVKPHATSTVSLELFR